MFEEFSAQNSTTWKSIIEKELKGKSFDETLVYENSSGLTVQPFYHYDTHLPSFENQNYDTQWTPVGGLFLTDDNFQMLTDFRNNYLQQGITHIVIWLGKNIPIERIIEFDFPVGLECLTIIHNQSGGIHKTILQADQAPQTIEIIDTLTVFEAGASALTELTWAYFQWLRKPEINSITMGVGKNYYSEIAKFRAIRLLIENQINLHAVTGLHYLTETDEHNNLLRNVTASISAIIGGCDELTIHPYDVIHSKYNPQSQRWANNIHHLLKHESHLDKIGDPVKGSFFLESLTQALVTQTREKVAELQRSSDTHVYINAMIEADFEAKKSRLNEKKEVIINVNQHVSGSVKKGNKITDLYAQVYDDGRAIRYDEDLIA